MSLNLSARQECCRLNFVKSFFFGSKLVMVYELGHEISNNVVCAIRKALDQHVHMRRLIRAFASLLDNL